MKPRECSGLGFMHICSRTDEQDAKFLEWRWHQSECRLVIHIICQCSHWVCLHGRAASQETEQQALKQQITVGKSSRNVFLKIHTLLPPLIPMGTAWLSSVSRPRCFWSPQRTVSGRTWWQCGCVACATPEPFVALLPERRRCDNQTTPYTNRHSRRSSSQNNSDHHWNLAAHA